MSKLVIFRGDAVEKEVHLTGGTIRIGRDNRNDVVLDDKSVSRSHAEVRADGDTYFIVDLKSRNGVWINGQQIKGKAALALGVPVTLGAYELALEDDVSTGPFEESPLLSQQTVVNAEQSDRPSATRASTRSAASAKKRQVLLWSGFTAAVLVICVVTFVVIRYRNPPTTTVEVVEPPAAPEAPQRPPPLSGSPANEATARLLADARTAIESRNFDAALRDHLIPLLQIDPGNTEALELKRQADEAIAARPPVAAAAPKPAPTPAEVETPGISRHAGEAWADYTARAGRIQVNFQEGNRALERQDFALAIARFQLVNKDQNGYQNVDNLITDTIAKQRHEVETAIGNGQLNEKAGRLADALKWYQQAGRFDPNSTAAREKIASLTERVTKDGLAAFERAEVFRKRSDFRQALEYYKRAADLLPPGHEKSREALAWLEKLKP